MSDRFTSRAHSVNTEMQVRESVKLQRGRRRSVWHLTLLAAALFWTGCSRDPEEPEAQIRRSIETAETAAVRKDVSELQRIISERYVDGRGLTRQNVSGLVAYYLNRYQSVHLFTRVKEVTLTDESHAHVDLVVAIAGQPIDASSDFSNLRADLYRFNLRFVKEGSDAWRITRADWRRGRPIDFL